MQHAGGTDDTRGTRPMSDGVRKGALGLVFLIALTVGLLLITGFFQLGDPVTSKTKVAVIGDSLTMQSSWAISSTLDRAGYLTAVSGLNGAGIGTQHDQLVSYTGYSGADIIVAALGTNNAFFASTTDSRHLDLDKATAELDRSAQDVLEGPADRTYPLSVKCLVWVNINDHTDVSWLREHGPQINRAIADLAAKEVKAGHQMIVADWADGSRDHPEYFLPDQIHLTRAGQGAYADLIRDSVRACSI